MDRGTHAEAQRLRHLGRTLGLVVRSSRFNACARRPATLAVLVLGLTRPHPCVKHTQRFSVSADSTAGVQMHAALRLIAQRAQALNRLAVEVQLGDVVQAKNSL